MTTMNATTNAATAVQQAEPISRRPILRRALIITGWIIAILVILAAALYAWMSYVPADLDLSTTRTSEQGLYQVSYSSEAGTVPVNQMHRWTIHVETADGQPVEDAQIRVDGDMPQHGHGLPTRPQVTRYLGNGDYLVEGLKFHMPGWWVMDFVITARGQTDQVRFNMVLQ